MNALNLNQEQVVELKSLIALKDAKDAENQVKANDALITGSLDALLESCENEYTAKIAEMLTANALPVNEDTIDKIKAI